MNGERQEWLAHAGLPVRSYFPRRFNPKRGLVEVNGERIEDFDSVPSDGSCVIFAHLPMEPSSATLFFLLLLTVQVIGIALSVLLRPRPPSLVGPGKEDEARPSFIGPNTRVGPNVPVPVVMGTIRVGGHVIESFTDTHLSNDGAVEVNDPLFGTAVVNGVFVFSKKVLKQSVTGREERTTPLGSSVLDTILGRFG